MGDTNANSLSTTRRSLELLEVLRDEQPIGLTELADAAGLDKGTTHHHLSTLADMGYVVNRGGRYQLGWKSFGIGGYLRHRSQFYRISREWLDGVAADTGLMGLSMTEQDGIGVFLYHTSGNGEPYIEAYAGRHEPLNSTALGKAILSEMPEDRVSEIIDRHGLPERTHATITDRERLFEELAEIDERGYATAYSEFVEGVTCIAVPVCDDTGEVHGAIGVADSTTSPGFGRHDDIDREQLVERLAGTKKEIETRVSLWHVPIS